MSVKKVDECCKNCIKWGTKECYFIYHQPPPKDDAWCFLFKGVEKK